MFHNTAMKIALWCAFILMSVSIPFSMGIYNVSVSKASYVLQDYVPNRLDDRDLKSRALLEDQFDNLKRSLFATLLYINLLIVFSGGGLSYVIAMTLLKPIRRVQMASSRFASDASHGLRTPLTAMRLEIEGALQGKNLPEDEYRELLQSNLEEIDRLSSLSQTLMKLSKLDYSGLNVTTIELGATATNIIHKGDGAGRVKIEQPDEPLIVRANPESIEELIAILVDNALKYSPPKSKIAVKMTRKGKYALFQITNSGEGIAYDKLPHVFERFFRGEKTESPKSGAGLGLSLARDIIIMHQGKISVESEPGKHTTFTFQIPLFPKDKKSAFLKLLSFGKRKKLRL